MSVKLHRQAEAQMAEAELLVSRGRLDEARSHWLEAARLEAQAFAQIPRDRGKTRGIIAVSAVALFRDAGAFDEAFRTGKEYLATGDLPDAWQTELRALLDSMSAERQSAAARPAHDMNDVAG
jgi:hypothetical protein